MSMKKLKIALSPKTLRELVATGIVTGAIIRYDAEGQGLVGIALSNDREWFLGATQGDAPRYFTSLEGVVSAMQACGINEFNLDARGFVSRGKKESARRGFGRSAQG